MPAPGRGGVWLVDLGMVATVRPCPALSIPAGPHDRALVTLIAHTTSTRSSRFEVSVNARFLRAGAFDAQNMVTVPETALLRRLGTLSAGQLPLVEEAVRRRLAR